MNRLTYYSLFALFVWLKNHPNAQFCEFLSAFERSKEIVDRNIPSCDDDLK